MVSTGRTNRARLFIAVIGLALVSSVAMSEEMKQAPKAEQPSSDQAKHAPKLAPVSQPQRTSPPRPKAEGEKSSAQGEKKDIEPGSWPDWVMVAFTLALVWLSWRQHVLEKRLASDAAESMDIAKRSADAATSQIALANKAYLVENRPWVGIFDERVSSLEIKNGAGTLAVTLTLRNTGITPAHRVWIDALLIPEKRPELSIAKFLNKFALPRAFQTDEMMCIFPNQDWAFDFKIVCDAEGILNSKDVEQGRALIFTVAGIIYYSSETLEQKPPHATSFAYRVARSGDRYIHWPGDDIFLDGADLQIKRWPNGWRAD